MGNAVGCANIPEYVRAGVTVGLGTDGYTSDMLESCKAAGVLAKHHSQDPGAGAEIPGLLFQSNAAMANRYFKTPLGVLKAGAAGDIIVVDYHPFTPMDGGNAGGHLLFGACGRDVTTTIVAGRVLMEDRVFPGLDAQKLLADARQQARDLWRRLNG